MWYYYSFISHSHNHGRKCLSLLLLTILKLLLDPPIISDNQQLSLPYPEQRKTQIDQEEDDQHDDEDTRDYPVCRRVHLDGE